MSTQSVPDVLKAIGFGIELSGGNPMRARAYTGAARTLKKIPDLRAARESGELASLKGIGKGILAIVDQVHAGEPVPKLEELKETVPEGLFAARHLSGLGAKRLRKLWQGLDITSIGELEYACNENRLIELDGFGKGTQDKVLAAIAALRAKGSTLRLDHADALAARWVAELTERPEIERVEVTGALRRRTETVSRVELLVLQEGLNAHILGGAARFEGGIAWADIATDDGAVSVALCPDADLWGVWQVLCTGSAEHVALLDQRAAKDSDDDGLGADGLIVRGAPVPCWEEEEVYRELGLLPTTPELREAGVPLTQVGTALPTLLRREDIAGMLHNHTTSSDGVHGLAAMRAAATAMGLQYLGISEHSESAMYAGGLTADRLLAQVEEIAALVPEGGCAVLSGIETDILRDGDLDYDDDVLGALDVVVASVHMRHRQDFDTATARMVRAASDPRVHIIGHPTGRLLSGRPASDFDVLAMLDAAAESGCAMELNANPQRLDLSVRYLQECKARGIPVSIAADAHSTHALSHLDYGVDQARRAGLRPDHVLNCRPLPALRTWLQQRI
ncbi:MAG: hypothetical protein KDA24_21140 [Deltaproteobacteria bacterium]|nr:hypothetical protein [Deltaproteobacteria bacterium]